MNDLSAMGWESDAQFAELSDEGRRKVRARCRACDRILKTTQRKGHVIAQEANRLGICGSAMRRLVKVYEDNGGCWRSMIDRRIDLRDESGAVPPAFWDFLRDMCEKNQRTSAWGFREIRKLYHAKATSYRHSKDGVEIELWPGYIDERGRHVRPEPLPATGLPRGWSERNFYNHCLTKLEKVLARQGPLAASNYLAMTYTTRVNLKPGSDYVFDDRWLDMKSVIDGMDKPVRSIELSAGDIFSGKTVSWDLFPLHEVEDENGTKKREQIKGAHMRLLLVDLLCFKGFHRDGVNLWLELGTATTSEELEHLLCTLSGGTVEEADVRIGDKTVRKNVITKPGKVRVKYSGTQGGKDFAGGFPTLGKGNFRFKAGWESTHALKHTEMAHLPGQTGKNERMEPFEELHGRDAASVKFMMAATAMRPDVARAIRDLSHFLPFRQLYWAYDAVLKAIEDSPNHDIEGWAEAGLETVEYRLKQADDAWHPIAELEGLPPAQRKAIEAYISETSWCTRKRFLSRKEAWMRGQDDLVRLPLHCAPLILGNDLSKLRTVTDKNYIQVNDPAVGNDPMFFFSVVKRPDGQLEKLNPGTEYRTWLNPLCAKTLFVADVDGRYIGTCRFDRIDKNDGEAFEQDRQRVKAENAVLIKDPLRRGKRRNRQQTADTKKVNALLAGGPATEAERQLEADRQARAAAKASQVSATPTPASSDEEDETIPDFSGWNPVQ